jgi:maltooligosyltrehalose trehalohydrolase
VNLDGDGSDEVRALLLDNALHWMREYHADGLRLDATHALVDHRHRHFVGDLADAAHAASGGRALVYAEDHRNLARMVRDSAAGGWGLDGLWADDFHHVVRRMIAGDSYGYYQDYAGSASELATTLRDGWLFTGQHSTHLGGPRGTSADSVALRKCVVCVQNHDQIGNRALGDRLHHRADPAAWRAAVAVLLLAPMTPLLFMGQEWSCTAPFQFFTDFEPGLGEAVVAGRRREFAAFPEFAGDASARIPSPQDVATFDASRLRWDEQDRGEHAHVLALHRALLRLRQTHAGLQGIDERTCDARALDDDTVCFRRGPRFLAVARLRGSGRVDVVELQPGGWRALLDTESPAFAPDPRPPHVDGAGIRFERPGALLFQRMTA